MQKRPRQNEQWKAICRFTHVKGSQFLALHQDSDGQTSGQSKLQVQDSDEESMLKV